MGAFLSTWAGDINSLNPSFPHLNEIRTYLIELLCPLSEIKHGKYLAHSRLSVGVCGPPHSTPPILLLCKQLLNAYHVPVLGHWGTRV